MNLEHQDSGFEPFFWSGSKSAFTNDINFFGAAHSSPKPRPPPRKLCSQHPTFVHVGQKPSMRGGFINGDTRLYPDRANWSLNDGTDEDAWCLFKSSEMSK